MHKEEKEVKNIQSLQNHSDRKKKWRDLLKQGIARHNESLLGGEIPLMTLRKSRKEEDFRYICTNCNMIFLNTSIANHKKICNEEGKMTARKEGVIKCIPKTFSRKDTSFLEEDFYSSVYDVMKQDCVKEALANDIELQYIANFKYKKLKMNRSNEKSPSDGARRMIRIITRFKIIYNEDFQNNCTLSEILNLDNWSKMEKTIKKLIYGEVNLKRGIAIQLRVGIEFSCNALQSFYTMYRPDMEKRHREEIVHGLSQFKEQFIIIKSIAFGNIGVNNLDARAKNRAAGELPSTETMQAVISTSNALLTRLDTKNLCSQESFLRLRRAVFTRLVFFNGRRPAEIANLTMEQWDLSKKNYYLTEQQKTAITSEALEVLESYFKVIITIGKSTDVPVVIPKITFDAMDALCNLDIREKCQINLRNKYIFPSGCNSTACSSGYDNFKQFMKFCEVDQSKLSSVNARKFLANELAALDFPEATRKLIFEFFGHMENVNKIHYAAPNLGKVLDSIAPTLQKINNKYDSCFEWEADDQLEKLRSKPAEASDLPDLLEVEPQPSSDNAAKPTTSKAPGPSASGEPSTSGTCNKRFRAAVPWTPRKKRRLPHDFFSSKFIRISM